MTTKTIERPAPTVVTEFPEIITLSPTEDDIWEGVRESIDKCPIGLALQRLFPTNKVLVGFPGYCTVDTRKYRYDKEVEVSHFTRAFDLGLPVEPITFTAKLVGEK